MPLAKIHVLKGRYDQARNTKVAPSITRPSCAPSAPLSPMGASAIARTSPTASRMRRQLSSECWKAATSANR